MFSDRVHGRSMDATCCLRGLASVIEHFITSTCPALHPCVYCTHHAACGVQGVRSVGIMDRILSSGSGRGRIAFFDLRAHDYISVQQEALSRPQTPIAPQSFYVPPTESVLHNSIYNFADYDDYSDEEDSDDGEDDDYTDVDEDDEVSEHNDVSQDNGVNHDSDVNEGDHNNNVEAGVDGTIPAMHGAPAWQHQPPGPPSFRRPMPVPPALAFQPAHDYVLTAQANLWLQTGNGWLDHNHVYM